MGLFWPKTIDSKNEVRPFKSGLAVNSWFV
jgi:hypothetical protein